MWQRLRFVRCFMVNPDRRANEHSRRNLESTLYRLLMYRQTMEHIHQCKWNLESQSMLLVGSRSFRTFLAWSGTTFTLRATVSSFVPRFGKGARGDASLRRSSLLSSIRPSFPPPWKDVCLARMCAAHDVAVASRSIPGAIRADPRDLENEISDSRWQFFFLLHFFL